MPANLVSTACLGNLNDPSYELLLRRELGGVFETDGLPLDWDRQAFEAERKMNSKKDLAK